MKSVRVSLLKKLFFQLLLLPVTLISFGQNSNHLEISSSNNIIDRQMEYILSEYSARVETPKEFINGKEYEPYYLRSKSKPILLPDVDRTATIFTKTRSYSNLTLQYDTFLDELIYTDTSRTINFRFPQISLNKDIVKGFNLYFAKDSLVFKYIAPPGSMENLTEGYYEIVYNGRSKYVIRHTSSFYVREGLNEYKYVPENYINAGNGYYRVKNKGSLLKLFGEKSGEMKKYLHMARIRIKQADKNQIAAILKFYDSLLTSQR
jgi:hypothetical protein